MISAPAGATVIVTRTILGKLFHKHCLDILPADSGHDLHFWLAAAAIGSLAAVPVGVLVGFVVSFFKNRATKA